MQADRSRRPRICIVVAAPLTLKAFMLGHLRALAEFADVTAVADFTAEDEAFPWPDGVARVAVAIPRPISPWSDLRALAALVRQFRRGGYDLVHSVTPKAGLLAMLAAYITRVPLRLHTYTGQVWATRSGAMRALLKGADRMIAVLATQILADSASQREFLIREGVLRRERSLVLANGSLCGVDAVRFRPDSAVRERVRARHGIARDAVIFLYLGRFNRDKGVLDLARAFALLARPDAHLLLVGPDEEGLEQQIAAAAGASAARIHFVAFTHAPEDYFAAADVFCIPSYREGFPTTILEAAATGVPSIGSKIYGIADTMIDGETGLLFPVRDAAALADCMRRLMSDSALRRSMGERARERALRDFSADVVTAALCDYYAKLLATRENPR